MPKRKRKKSPSYSGFFGVKRSISKSCKSGYKWKGRIRINGEQVFIKGIYDTALECAKAYDLRGIKERIPLASKMTSIFFPSTTHSEFFILTFLPFTSTNDTCTNCSFLSYLI